MEYLSSFTIIAFIAILLIVVLKVQYKGFVTIVATLGMALVSSVLAVKSLMGETISFILSGTSVTGEIPIIIDPLSAWFILVINFTFITGAIYGVKYMQVYANKQNRLSLHWSCFILTHFAIIAVCAIQNSIAFLIAWEIMVICAFVLVIFEGEKPKTIKAGINYIIQSHIGIVFLYIAFIWVSSKTNTFDFASISVFASKEKHLFSFLLMLIFFIGFAIKAGFVPFHTWLPHAHPAAPSHISAIMSGVLIKIGIYGILRMILLVNTNYLAFGYFILFMSVITGIYGVMLAIVQHNLKTLLAYHSIENIGIIGIGIGVGCIGIGSNNTVLATFGFAGALLHTLNHSLFKSLLFFSAGNIYQALHSVYIEKLGGILKRMPHTALLFLIAALAICGLPPFNGFVSEYLIYGSLFNGILGNSFLSTFTVIVAILGLTLIGGLAILCFTKAFGIIFLGTERFQFQHRATESHWQCLLPMYMIVSLILAIGLFPHYFISILSAPLKQFTQNIDKNLVATPLKTETISLIGYSSIAFILLAAIIYFIRKKITTYNKFDTKTTWGCSYVSPNSKMQYTASSFIHNYLRIANPMYLLQKNKKRFFGIFPSIASHQTHLSDKMEENLINKPLRIINYFFMHFSLRQNGKLQLYILYGLIFIIIIVGVPSIIYLFDLFTNFLNTL